MRAAGQFAGNPFQIAAQLFELDAWSVVIGLGACLHYPSRQGFEPRRWRVGEPASAPDAFAELARLVGAPRVDDPTLKFSHTENARPWVRRSF